MKVFYFLLLLSLVAGKPAGTGTQLEIIERNEILSERLSVSWTIDFALQSVTFTLIAASHGFIGFGVSPNGGMAGADVIIGGVLPDGQPYFTDRYATGESEPLIDDHQDWFLIDALENSTHTVLHFNRSLNSCDPQDLPFTNDTTKFIWSLGATDTIAYHGEERGAAAVNILDPPMPAYDTSKFEIWDLVVNTTIPPRDTTYWCTVHKSPRYPSKRQLVGFEVFLNSTEAVKHNHHIIITMCQVAPGSEVSKLMDTYVGHPGGLCYENDGTGIDQLATYCQVSMYLWTKGGKPFFLDNDLGIPLNENGGEEYFYVEIHYDNPEILEGVQYETGLRIYVADELRPLEAGLLAVSYAVDITQTLPPSSRDFIYAAHCSSRCTGNQIPPEGIQIFNVLHHAHLSGRKLKFRHFRPTGLDEKFVELPWISNDDKYDFDFQSNRPLKEPVTLLPGDHLTVECTYDTSWKNPPTATFGGLSTREEMCEVVFMYYPKVPLSYCGSFHPLDDILPILGIEQLDYTSNGVDPIVLSPPEYSGKNYSTVLNTMLTWTDEMKDELEKRARFNDHVDECTTLWVEIDDDRSSRSFYHPSVENNTYWTNYPKDFEEYYPPPENCS